MAANANCDSISDLIITNLPFLIEKTSDRSKFLNLLHANKVIGADEYDEINHLLGDRKPNEKMWMILRTKDEDIVPKIIEYLNKTSCAKSVAQLFVDYLKTRDNVEVRNPEQGGIPGNQMNDFVVENVHIFPILNELQKHVGEHSEWNIILKKMIKIRDRADILKIDDLPNKMHNTLETWIGRSGKADRKYNHFISYFDGMTNLTEDLVKKSSEFSKLKAKE